MATKACSKYGLLHVLGRGIEFACLQTYPTAQVYRRVIPKYYTSRYDFDVHEYNSPIDPLRLRYVDPLKIDRFSARKDLHSVREAKYEIGSVIGGRWDTDDYSGRRYNTKKPLLYANTVSDTLLFQAMEKRYLEGCEWEETDFFKEITAYVDGSKQIWHGSTTKGDIKRRCEKIDTLYHNIEESGYLTQRELHGYRPSIDDSFGFLNERIDEITVDLSRDGDFLLVDSKHRLAIARLLEIDRVPVTVLVRHPRWMEHRDERFTSGRISDHPDFIEMQE